MAGDQMIRLCACVIVAIGAFSVNEAIGQAAGATLREMDAGLPSPNTEQLPTTPKDVGARQPPPGGNPLWGFQSARSTPLGNGRFFRRPVGRPCRRSWLSGW